MSSGRQSRPSLDAISSPWSGGPRSAIAVEGLDGSGKSRFAAALVEALTAVGRPATLVHVDDFRRALEFEGLAPEQESALYYDAYFDFAAVGAALAAALAGPADGAVAILEGVMALRAALPPGTPLVVLEVSPEEARRRIVARDQAKGRTPAEIARRIDRRYFPAQARYRADFDPLGRAALVVDNEDWARPRVVRRSDDRLPPGVAAVLDRLLGAE
jgi:uridine kinase